MRKKVFGAVIILTFCLQAQKNKTAYFASGCFWCVESIYESIAGVDKAISGYSGGFVNNPTYKQISKGTTGHAETVAVLYNPKKVSFQDLVNAFFASHDPTTKNGQYPDFGTQYRSIAFYTDNEEKHIIEKTIKRLNKETYNGKIVTQVKKMEVFYQAEEYHQDFKKRNPNHSYIKKVSVPRLNRFKKKCPFLLKE